MGDKKISVADLARARSWCEKGDGRHVILRIGSLWDPGHEHMEAFERGEVEGMIVPAGDSFQEAEESRRYTKDLDEGR